MCHRTNTYQLLKCQCTVLDYSIVHVQTAVIKKKKKEEEMEQGSVSLASTPKNAKRDWNTLLLLMSLKDGVLYP